MIIGPTFVQNYSHHFARFWMHSDQFNTKLANLAPNMLVLQDHRINDLFPLKPPLEASF